MPNYCPSKVLQIMWEEGLFLFPQVPHHLRSLHQLAACCSNSPVNLDCLVNYKHISKSFFLAFFLEWVTATPQLTEWSSMVFSQGSGRNMPHRDLIIYQHNVGFEPMRHQYIFLWSLTYCLLLSMLFSWLADKITVAVSKFTSNWSRGGKCLTIGSSYRHQSHSPLGCWRWGPWTGVHLWACASHGPLLQNQLFHTPIWETVWWILGTRLETEICNKVIGTFPWYLGLSFAPSHLRSLKRTWQRKHVLQEFEITEPLLSSYWEPKNPP